jgi:hypothetical protein
VTRDPLLPSDDDEDEPGTPSPRVHPTEPGPLLALLVVGLVLGWSLRPLSVWSGRTNPQIGWMPPMALLLVAAIMGYTAWLTHRSLHRRHPLRDAGLAPLAPHQAVNRLALAKACALIGALMAGGYLGFCLSWVGLPVDTALPRVARGLVAALAAGLLVAASLLLERACRVRNDEE